MPLFKVRSLFCPKEFRLPTTVILISGFIHSVVLLLASSCNEIRTTFFETLICLKMFRIRLLLQKSHAFISAKTWFGSYVTWCLLKEELSEWSKSCSEVLFFVFLKKNESVCLLMQALFWKTAAFKMFTLEICLT